MPNTVTAKRITLSAPSGLTARGKQQFRHGNGSISSRSWSRSVDLEGIVGIFISSEYVTSRRGIDCRYRKDSVSSPIPITAHTLPLLPWILLRMKLGYRLRVALDAHSDSRSPVSAPSLHGFQAARLRNEFRVDRIPGNIWSIKRWRFTWAGIGRPDETSMLRRVAEIEFPGDGGLCIEASSTVTGTVNCTRDEVGNLNSISLLSAPARPYTHPSVVATRPSYDSFGSREYFSVNGWSTYFLTIRWLQFGKSECYTMPHAAQSRGQ